MIPLSIDELQVDSDLQLDVDGVTARLVSDGSRVTLSTRDAAVFAARVLDTAPDTGLPLRGAVADLAAALDRLGLSAALVDDRGTVAEVGRNCRSTLGRLLLGSEFVRIGPVSVPVATALVRSSEIVRRRTGYAVGASALAGLLLVAGLRSARRWGER